MINLYKAQLSKMHRVRLVRLLKGGNYYHSIWEPKETIHDESITYVPPKGLFDYYHTINNYYFPHNKLVKVDWCTPITVVKYRYSTGRDWTVHRDKSSQSQSRTGGINYLALNKSFTIEFKDFEIDVPAGYWIIIPIEYEYRIPVVQFDTYIAKRFLMCKRRSKISLR